MKLAEDIGWLLGTCVRFTFIGLVAGCSFIIASFLILKFGIIVHGMLF